MSRRVYMDQTQFEVPDEFRHLGEFRQVFATTAGAMASSVFRSVVPLGGGCGLFALAAFWVVIPNWEYYLAILIGTLFTLQGVRWRARTLRRWNQKVLIFEKGIAISRLRELATYTWDRIEQ